MKPSAAIKWEDVCALPWLQDIPAKIETNRNGKILMSPASSWHGSFQFEIARELNVRLPEGRVITECPIETADGTRVADVAWMSRARWYPHRRAISLPIAPEICVEILSPSNQRAEMFAKASLYFHEGAQELWLCSENGNLEFLLNRHGEPDPQPRSSLCPEFPLHVSVE